MNKTISVTGTSVLSFAADIIQISATLSAQNPEYSKLLSDASEQLNELIRAAESCGFKKEQLKTSSFSVDTVYEYVNDKSGESKRRFSGYRFSQSLQIEFPLDMTLLKQVLTALFACKCAPEYSIHFVLKDNEGAKNDALKAACKQARQKAQLLAQSFGVELGAVISVNYMQNSDIPSCETSFMLARGNMQCDSAMPEITPGDVEISEEVNCVYELLG